MYIEVTNEYKEAVRQRDIISSAKFKIIENVSSQDLVELLSKVQIEVNYETGELEAQIPEELSEKLSFEIDENGKLIGRLTKDVNEITEFIVNEDGSLVLKINNEDFLPSSSLEKVYLKDYCNDEGKIVGTAMLKELEVILKNEKNYDFNGKEFEFYYGLKVGNNFEYIPYRKLYSYII